MVENESENYTTVKEEINEPEEFADKQGEKKDEKKGKKQIKNGRDWSVRIKNISDKVENLIEIVTQLTNVVKDIKSPPKPEIKVVKRDLVEETLPVPRIWREKAYAILGEGFEFKIDDTVNGDFILKIILPKELDRRVGEKMGERDISTGIVRRISPILDVETWCNKVKQNILKTYQDFKPLIK